jgi:transcriptional regulator with XRE-family HTH domain
MSEVRVSSEDPAYMEATGRAAEVLRIVRVRLGWRLKDMADAVGMDTSNYARLERGDVPLTAGTVLRFRDYATDDRYAELWDAAEAADVERVRAYWRTLR